MERKPDRREALGFVLICLCDTGSPSRIETWCTENGITEDYLNECIKLLAQETSFKDLSIL